MESRERVAVEIPVWAAALGDKGVQAALLLATCAAGGLAGLGLAWSGAAATLGVWVQVPFVVSGGFGGLAATGACLALLGVHLERRSRAVDRLQLDIAVRASAEIAESLPDVLVRAGRAGPHNGSLLRTASTVHRPDCRMAAGKHLPKVDDWRPTDGLRPCRICKPLVS